VIERASDRVTRLHGLKVLADPVPGSSSFDALGVSRAATALPACPEVTFAPPPLTLYE
jgi:hypothetical protein